MNKTVRFNSIIAFPRHQGGMVLLVSLVFLLLLTLLGISSMQNATLQEKMAGSVVVRNQSFQLAESALRLGESAIKAGAVLPAVCSGAACAPPAESTTVTSAGVGASGVTWTAAAGGGFYAVQNLGNTLTPIKWPSNCSSTVATLYRVTAVAIQNGTSRTVLESIYANC
ncbi:pilus assembly PilX family protein [Pseudomonas viridiflava]|uniref:PilX N-terminal domain-containing pilus assembly protein n=1 Tax=Pseudomonas viridiflava TaxID=33069 RepID=A0ABU7NF01_PSEVI|nr:PilX N-terminal domain-containing pilus assembly protein [Pseudomonas viridiflava]MBI6577899.1 pilus assembly protein PilX [Pseudomonas viridiflava]MBI6607632.1 pilus assembly protein PilX [Pseudomonas viridiflava]MBI6639781.1 pilus assembly protein PilX [Pseudomonas viridiflava]MBI6870101.1 pilus assembly protein PilX [Pseudomonas viridiflava]MEE3938869.1 PilX N-terminal domain-containing pilus assembly protein [Pseudomonas viridiflava]